MEDPPNDHYPLPRHFGGDGTPPARPRGARRNSAKYRLPTVGDIIKHIRESPQPCYGSFARAWYMLGFIYPEGQNDFPSRGGLDGSFEHLFLNLWDVLWTDEEDRESRRARGMALDALRTLGFYDPSWTAQTRTLAVDGPSLAATFTSDDDYWDPENEDLNEKQKPKTAAEYSRIHAKETDEVLRLARRQPFARGWPNLVPASSVEPPTTAQLRVSHHRYMGFGARDGDDSVHLFVAQPMPKGMQSIWHSLCAFDPRDPRDPPLDEHDGPGLGNKAPAIFEHYKLKARVWCYTVNVFMAGKDHVRYRDYVRLEDSCVELDGGLGTRSVLRHLHCNNPDASPGAQPPKELLHVISDFLGVQIVVFVPPATLAEFTKGHETQDERSHYEAHFFGGDRSRTLQRYLVTDDWVNYDAVTWADDSWEGSTFGSQLGPEAGFVRPHGKPYKPDLPWYPGGFHPDDPDRPAVDNEDAEGEDEDEDDDIGPPLLWVPGDWDEEEGPCMSEAYQPQDDDDYDDDDDDDDVDPLGERLVPDILRRFETGRDLPHAMPAWDPEESERWRRWRSDKDPGQEETETMANIAGWRGWYPDEGQWDSGRHWRARQLIEELEDVGQVKRWEHWNYVSADKPRRGRRRRGARKEDDDENYRVVSMNKDAFAVFPQANWTGRYKELFWDDPYGDDEEQAGQGRGDDDDGGDDDDDDDDDDDGDDDDDNGDDPKGKRPAKKSRKRNRSPEEEEEGRDGGGGSKGKQQPAKRRKRNRSEDEDDGEADAGGNGASRKRRKVIATKAPRHRVGVAAGTTITGGAR